MGIGDGQAMHARPFGGGDPSQRVLDYNAVLWLDSQPFGGKQENLRTGLAFGYLMSGDNALETVIYAQSLGDQLDILYRG